MRHIIQARDSCRATPEVYTTWLQLPSGVMLHLIESEEAPARSDNVHHAFAVEDYDAVVQALHGKNVPSERTGVRQDGQRYLFIRDPDGNRVELCTLSLRGLHFHSRSSVIIVRRRLHAVVKRDVVINRYDLQSMLKPPSGLDLSAAASAVFQ